VVGDGEDGEGLCAGALDVLDEQLQEAAEVPGVGLEGAGRGEELLAERLEGGGGGERRVGGGSGGRRLLGRHARMPRQEEEGVGILKGGASLSGSGRRPGCAGRCPEPLKGSVTP
jgi:hypothetical protein